MGSGLQDPGPLCRFSLPFLTAVEKQPVREFSWEQRKLGGQVGGEWGREEVCTTFWAGRGTELGAAKPRMERAAGEALNSQPHREPGKKQFPA